MKLFLGALAPRSSAMAATAEASKEKIKMSKLQTYLNLMYKDSSSFNDLRLNQHEQVLEQLQWELFGYIACFYFMICLCIFQFYTKLLYLLVSCNAFEYFYFMKSA
jgi:hypothetical protein